MIKILILFIVIFLIVIKFTPKKQTISSEQNNVNVSISNIPDSQKMKIMQIVRTTMGIGLKEANDYIENNPQIMLKNIDFDYANRIKHDLTKYGIMVEILGTEV